MNVAILVTIPNEESFDACTLCFDTLRVGFPTSFIRVYFNDLTPQHLIERAIKKLRAAKKPGAPESEIPTYQQWGEEVHHAAWIREVIQERVQESEWRERQGLSLPTGPMIILDADTIFWKSCEDWEFGDAPLAGHFIPYMWNDFSNCMSMPRLHTSCLYIKDPAWLMKEIVRVYPQAHDETGDYSPCDPFRPRVQFMGGKPYFWDTCANLYHMIGGAAFDARHFDCYEHINSASFFEVMRNRLENKEGFQALHRDLIKTPEKLKGLWANVHRYYREKEVQGKIYEATK